MAVVVWKEGKSKRVEPENLKTWENMGWSTSNPNRPPAKHEGGPVHIGMLDFPEDATPLEKQEIVLGKMHIKV